LPCKPSLLPCSYSCAFPHFLSHCTLSHRFLSLLFFLECRFSFDSTFIDLHAGARAVRLHQSKQQIRSHSFRYAPQQATTTPAPTTAAANQQNGAPAGAAQTTSECTPPDKSVQGIPGDLACLEAFVQAPQTTCPPAQRKSANIPHEIHPNCPGKPGYAPRTTSSSTPLCGKLGLQVLCCM